MNDTHKTKFWLMINVAMELTNHPPLTKEAIITWWHKLSKYDYEQVESALNKWTDSSNKAPTPHDILNLCQHKVTIYAKQPSPLALADNKRHADEVVEFVAKHIKPKTDYRAWARKIIDSPAMYSDIAIRYAKEALNMPLSN